MTDSIDGDLPLESGKFTGGGSSVSKRVMYDQAEAESIEMHRSTKVAQADSIEMVELQ